MTDVPRHGSGLVGFDQQRLHAGAGDFVPHGAEMGKAVEIQYGASFTMFLPPSWTRA